MGRLAVVLFNLGGPDAPEAVRLFLVNLFSDPAIIAAPSPLRGLLARLVAWRRAPAAAHIYRRLGGASPLLEMSRAQAAALEARLGDGAAGEVRVFIAMRYWHPRADETAVAVKAFAPEKVILLPLYPQFSTTTTGSSLVEWRRVATAVWAGGAYLRALCCYPTDGALVAAHAALLARALETVGRSAPPRVLFSAHGLPKRVVAGGDPYVWQVEATARAVAHLLAGLDWVVCYQSKVGPLEWVGPAIAGELRRAAADGASVVVVPIAFVSEHAETLVELDMQYAAMAKELGVPAYVRVPALGVCEGFIDGLAGLARAALAETAGRCARRGGRLCPEAFARCPFGRAVGSEA